MDYQIYSILMIFFYVATAILALCAVLLFFKLNIKDVMIRLSNKEEDDGVNVPLAESAVMSTGSIENIAHQQQMTTMLDNKGRTVLLDEPFVPGAAAAPAAPKSAVPKQPVSTNANFKVVKNIISVDTNETI